MISSLMAGLQKRCVATFEFESGKVAWYDFDSEQYRSPIRKNTLKVQGVRGELIDDCVYYLDENNEGQTGRIITDSHVINTGNSNPNFEKIREIKKNSFNNKIIYEPEFGLCGLSEDETAIAVMMKNTAEYSRGNASAPYSMEDALADAYASILLKKAVETGEVVHS